MVSGWDKSPGPDNDYAPKPWKWWEWVAFTALIVALVSVLAFSWRL